MDENIDNYSIQDLYDILKLNHNNTIEDINIKINNLNKKLEKKGKNNLVDFFEKAKKKIEMHLNTNLIESDSENISDDEKEENKTYMIDKNIIERKFLNKDHFHNVNITQDVINPNYKNMINRLICIDSDFRQHILPYKKDNLDSISSATNFTMDLSEPLKNIVSMKLYSYSIP